MCVEILGVFLSHRKFQWYFDQFGERERERMEGLCFLEVESFLRSLKGVKQF